MRLIRGLLALCALVLLAPAAAFADPAGAASSPGTAGTQSWLGGCVYLSSPPTLTNGQQIGRQCDADGSGYVNVRDWTVSSATVLGHVILDSGTVTPTQSGVNVSVTPTIQNAAYASGNCMGGFQTVALGASASVLNAVTLASKGGLATAKQVYLFSANPTGSTCTDKGTFTIAAADVSKVIATLSITPAAPTGTTITFGTAGSQGYGVPSGGTLYAAIVETAAETPASTTDLVLNFSGF